MKGISVIRRLVDRRSTCNLRSISTAINFSSPSNPLISLKLSFSNSYSIAASATARLHFSNPSLQFQRTLCSSSGSSNIVLIKSEEQFNSSLKNVQDKSLPAVFYFTAVWCGPCKFISPVLSEQSGKYPHVTTYKIDIDEEGLENVLRRFYIRAVPTLLFFQNGKKAAEIVGVDVESLKDTMEELYGED